LKLFKKKIFCWACDYNKDTGEGKLARLYIKINFKNCLIKISTPSKVLENFKLIQHRYISPFVGIILCWIAYFDKKQTIYINYLPLWNFLIFLLLPPKTLIGPITGGARFKNSVIRKYLFPLFYKISQLIIYFRYQDVIFSTDLLKKYLYNYFLKKSKFNFILNILKKKNYTLEHKKKLDFLIYYRNHENKRKFFPYLFIKELIALNYKIYVFGDKLLIDKVHNLGKISNEKVNKLLRKTRYTISSGENALSIFTLECINNNVKVLTNSRTIFKYRNLKSNFIYVNYNSGKFKDKLK
jgi:hypothetical protein